MDYIHNIIAGSNGVTNIELFRCDSYVDAHGNNYLHATYRIESDDRVEEVDMPKVYIPTNRDNLTIAGETHCGVTYYYTDLGTGRVRLLPDKNGSCFTVKVIKEKTKEMTLEEIEKKLGHKVKIVNK